MFSQPGRDAETGLPAGVTITRDAYGVPSVTGATDDELWWGAGYATAEDRLFELEVFRRATTGTSPEVLGSSLHPDGRRDSARLLHPGRADGDVDRLPPAFQARYTNYAAGING